MLRFNARTSVLSFILAAPLGFLACGGNDEPDPDGSGGANTGGNMNSGGGSTGGATGGANASGGQNPGTGGIGTGGAGTGGMGAGGSGGSGGGGGGGTGTGGAGTGGDDGSGGNGSGGNGSGGDGGGIVPGTASYNCSPAEGSFAPGDIGVEELVSGLSVPILVTHAPDDPRLFVVEQGGTIQVVEDGAVAGTFLDIADQVLSPSNPGGAAFSAESGLLGLAFHPNYAENGLFYVHYTALSPQGETTIAEYSVSTSDPNQADPGSARVMLTLTQPDHNHNGGTITFGSDSMLYIGLGDGGPLLGSDPNGHGQNPATLLGSILRIDPVASGGEPYSSPSGNLKDTLASAAPEVWDYGLRNPFRFNFDGCTGDLYIGDVGQSRKEELNIEKAGEGGKNYGWNIKEGTVCRPAGGGVPAADCSDTSGLTEPVFDYDNPGGAAIIGGAVYRGSEFPALLGTYFFADNGNGRVWITQFDREANSISEPVNITSSLGALSKPAAIQNGNDGELYIAEAQSGSILKIVLAQ